MTQRKADRMTTVCQQAASSKKYFRVEPEKIR